MLDNVTYWLIGIGLAFDLFGCIGLIRLPDIYNRAQAATKCVTLGTCTILLAVAVRAFGLADGGMGVKAIICITFVLLTSPVGAHAVCRGAYLSGVPLWAGSVEDAFADRAEAIRGRPSQEGAAQREEAETP